MGELATCVKYKLPIKVVVIKNNTLGQIKWEQMVFLGNPEYGCELQPIDFAAVAAAAASPASVDDPARCGAVLREALATPGPVLVEAVVDPNEPPMPPKATLKQAAHLAEALARGAPTGAGSPDRRLRQGARAGLEVGPMFEGFALERIEAARGHAAGAAWRVQVPGAVAARPSPNPCDLAPGGAAAGRGGTPWSARTCAASANPPSRPTRRTMPAPPSGPGAGLRRADAAAGVRSLRHRRP